MSEHIKKKQEARRKELLDVALTVFMEVGYEKSSIRLLASRAGGDIGLIYHYFDSKTDIYEAALAYYNEKYLGIVAGIVDDAGLTFEEKIDRLFVAADNSLAEYRPMSAEGNIDMVTILLVRAMTNLAPVFDKLICAYLEERSIYMEVSERLLTSHYILYGFSGIIHALGDQSMQQRYAVAKQLLYETLDQIESRTTE